MRVYIDRQIHRRIRCFPGRGADVSESVELSPEKKCKPGVLRHCYFGCKCAANYLRFPYC
jgi:hypothetical protein